MRLTNKPLFHGGAEPNRWSRSLGEGYHAQFAPSNGKGTVGSMHRKDFLLRKCRGFSNQAFWIDAHYSAYLCPSSFTAVALEQQDAANPN